MSDWERWSLWAGLTLMLMAVAKMGQKIKALEAGSS